VSFISVRSRGADRPQSASSSLSGLSTGSVVRILRGDAIVDPGTQERLAALDR